MTTLVEAIKSGKPFKRYGKIYKVIERRLYHWLGTGWVLSENESVEYCDDPALKPRQCTFQEAWEHMKKYPNRPVCQNYQEKYYWDTGEKNIINSFTGESVFADFAIESIFDGEWKLFPQQEGE